MGPRDDGPGITTTCEHFGMSWGAVNMVCVWQGSLSAWDDLPVTGAQRYTPQAVLLLQYVVAISNNQSKFETL